MHMQFLPLLVRVTLFTAVFQAVALQTVRADEELVRVQPGELPIIISAPHGGRLDVPDVDLRTGRGLVAGPSGYVMSRDTGTEELADEVLKAIDRRFGKPAYAVIARFHRKHIDANRPADEAYEDPDAKATYDRYHNQLDSYCREVQKKFGKGLLLDLHGQGSEPETVFRGTQDGKTVKLLRERYGEAAHNGPDSLFGRFKARGWTVHPDPFEGREQDGFRGGFIVQTYGSHRPLAIDAVQLEFGGEYRDPMARQKTAATLADAVSEYSVSFLGVAPATPPPPPPPLPEKPAEPDPDDR